MTTPTAQRLLRQLATTREQDQRRRQAELLARWALLIGAAGMLPALVVGLVVAR